jgi:hypothetical protein
LALLALFQFIARFGTMDLLSCAINGVAVPHWREGANSMTWFDSLLDVFGSLNLFSQIFNLILTLLGLFGIVL